MTWFYFSTLWISCGEIKNVRRVASRSNVCACVASAYLNIQVVWQMTLRSKYTETLCEYFTSSLLNWLATLSLLFFNSVHILRKKRWNLSKIVVVVVVVGKHCVENRLMAWFLYFFAQHRHLAAVFPVAKDKGEPGERKSNISWRTGTQSLTYTYPLLTKIAQGLPGWWLSKIK